MAGVRRDPRGSDLLLGSRSRLWPARRLRDAVLADHDQVWSFVGFPTYGDGPFEDIGVETTVPLRAAFVLICAGEAIVGWMLWQHRSSATTLSLALLPLELVFWIGFALPFAFVLGAARTVLVDMARAAARRGRQPARR